MKNRDLHLDLLSACIAKSFQAGIITFDPDMHIVDHTPNVATWLRLEPTVYETLARGTDPNIWGDWRQTLASVFETGTKADFGVIKYQLPGLYRLLHVTCMPASISRMAQRVGGVMILLDVTDKLETEQEMAQAERLMAIGKVAGKVAHELNNPLDGILRYVNLTLRILDQNQPDKAREYLTHCRNGLQRMAQIITEMLEFSRSANHPFETSPLDKLLDDALRSMEGPLRQIEVRVIRAEPGPLPHVKSDSLYQVFCNLIKNACDAMGTTGTLTVTMTREEQECRIAFQDTGHGFDPDKTDDLFRPFYTTKSKGRGTGLGLAICKDILEKLGGTITARNIPDGGSIFTVTLPCGPQTLQPNKT